MIFLGKRFPFPFAMSRIIFMASSCLLCTNSQRGDSGTKLKSDDKIVSRSRIYWRFMSRDCKITEKIEIAAKNVHNEGNEEQKV